MNILQQYLADRANRGQPPKNPITNDAAQVTRAEFNVLARAVEALVEDVEAVLKPEKITAALNAALKDVPALQTNAQQPRTGRLGEFQAPTADDDDAPAGGAITNRFTAPKGDD